MHYAFHTGVAGFLLLPSIALRVFIQRKSHVSRSMIICLLTRGRTKGKMHSQKRGVHYLEHTCVKLPIRDFSHCEEEGEKALASCCSTAEVGLSSPILCFRREGSGSWLQY